MTTHCKINQYLKNIVDEVPSLKERTHTSCLSLPLQAVISGQQQSRWFRSFLSASRRRVVNIYLEDDQQLDQVYWYLNELYANARASASAPLLAKMRSMERVPFVLDVLLPEVIIAYLLYFYMLFTVYVVLGVM